MSSSSISPFNNHSISNNDAGNAIANLSDFVPPTIRPSDIWIGDLLFLRQNRPLKYTENGDTLILVETFQLDDVWQRLVHSLGWLCIHSDAILLNFLLLLLSFRKTRQQAYHKKLQFLIGNLAVCNIVLALGLLVYTLLIDVYYNVDSFDTLMALMGGNNNTNLKASGSKLWHFAKFLIHAELVENFFIVQQWVLLLASADRYASLFERCYTPNAKHKLPLLAICGIPYLVALLLFDRFLLLWWWQLPPTTVNIIRLLALLCPLLLSLVFCACSIFGLLQRRRLLQRIFGHSLFSEEFSFSATVMAILFVDTIGKFGIFLELLGANFSIQITTGSANGDAKLRQILDGYFWFCHFLLLISPLFQSLICLLFLAFYRRQLFSGCARLLRCSPCCRRRRSTLDYSCETMRSIIAEQTRARHMRGGGIVGIGTTWTRETLGGRRGGGGTLATRKVGIMESGTGGSSSRNGDGLRNSFVPAGGGGGETGIIQPRRK